MTLDNDEYKLKKKCLNIIKKYDIQTAIEKISKLKFRGKELGNTKAKNVCKIYVTNFVDVCNKPDNYNYIREINDRCKFLK